MDAASLDGLAGHFQEKLDTLNTVMDLMSVDEDDSDGYEAQVVSLQNELDNLQVVMVLMRTEVQKCSDKLKETQELKQTMESVLASMNHAITNIPARLPKPVHKELDIREEPAATSKAPGTQKKNSAHEVTSKENHPPQKVQSGGRKQPKTVYIPTLDYITVAEFDSVPKYIKGRINYNQVNSIIDELNKAYKEKYKIMSMKRTTLSDVNRKRFEKFKLQESKETTGEHFIVDEDVKEFCKVKMDSVFRSILTLLRHCGRLKEIRGGGHTRFAYVVVY